MENKYLIVKNELKKKEIIRNYFKKIYLTKWKEEEIIKTTKKEFVLLKVMSPIKKN